MTTVDCLSFGIGIGCKNMNALLFVSGEYFFVSVTKVSD